MCEHATSNKNKASPSTSKQQQTPPVNIQKTTSNEKLDQILVVLQNVKSTIDSTSENVKLHREESKANAKEMAEIKANKPSFASLAASLGSSSQYPPLQQKPKRRRVNDSNDSVGTPTKFFRNRKLVAGTGAQVDHGLGSPVTKSTTRTRTQSNLTKSIYVSRLSPTVNSEQLRTYITSRVDETSQDDIDLRMLVKKDQKLEDLTFISYRILCTENLYERLINSSFWPSHVFIGDFVERPRPSRIVTTTLEDNVSEDTQNDAVVGALINADVITKSPIINPNDCGNTSEHMDEDV